MVEFDAIFISVMITLAYLVIRGKSLSAGTDALTMGAYRQDTAVSGRTVRKGYKCINGSGFVRPEQGISI